MTLKYLVRPCSAFTYSDVCIAGFLALPLDGAAGAIVGTVRFLSLINGTLALGGHEDYLAEC